MGIRVRLCSDWCLREADGESDYPQTAVSCIVRTQYPYFAQRLCRDYRFRTYIGIALKFLFQFFSGEHFVALQVFVDGLLYNVLRQGPVVAWMGGEPVTGELLVEGWLAVANLVAFYRPETGAVRCEHLITDHHVSVFIQTKFEFGICDNDSLA